MKRTDLLLEKGQGAADGEEGEARWRQEGTELGGDLARTQVQARLPLTLAMPPQVTSRLTSILESASDLVGTRAGALLLKGRQSAWEHR